MLLAAHAGAVPPLPAHALATEADETLPAPTAPQQNELLDSPSSRAGAAELLETAAPAPISTPASDVTVTLASCSSSGESTPESSALAFGLPWSTFMTRTKRAATAGSVPPPP